MSSRVWKIVIVASIIVLTFLMWSWYSWHSHHAEIAYSRIVNAKNTRYVVISIYVIGVTLALVCITYKKPYQ